MRLNVVALAVCLASLALACGPSEPPVQDPGLAKPDRGLNYPAPPYGTTKGETIQNLELYGYKTPTTPWLPLKLSDFYDPEGSKGPGGVPLKLLIVNVSAVWCSVCKVEAPLLLDKCKANREKGLACYTAIFEDEAYNPAERIDVNWWKQRFGIDYPITVDTLFKWGAYFNKSATPMNMYIDPKTMKIVDVVVGFDEAAMDALITEYVGP
jgi:thiol-disulfide isomerase/thioredoxin